MNSPTGLELIPPEELLENRFNGTFRKDAGLTRGVEEDTSPFKSGEDHMRQVKNNLISDQHRLNLDETNI